MITDVKDMMKVSTDYKIIFNVGEHITLSSYQLPLIKIYARMFSMKRI